MSFIRNYSLFSIQEYYHMQLIKNRMRLFQPSI